MCVHGFVSGQVKNYTTKDNKQKSFVGEVRYKFREGEHVDVFKIEHLTRCLRAQGEEIELNSDYDYTDDTGQTRKVERRAIKFYKFNDWYNLEVTRGEGKYTYQNVVGEDSFETFRELLRNQNEYNSIEFG